MVFNTFISKGVSIYVKFIFEIDSIFLSIRFSQVYVKILHCAEVVDIIVGIFTWEAAILYNKLNLLLQ